MAPGYFVAGRIIHATLSIPAQGNDIPTRIAGGAVVRFLNFVRKASCLPMPVMYLHTMTYPGVADIEELSRETLSQFGRRLAAIPADLCTPFHEEARQLETELLSVYRFVVVCTRNEADLDRVAELWSVMVRICDNSARQLCDLVQRHPSSGAECYYDRVLDLRNKCHRLQKLHR